MLERREFAANVLQDGFGQSAMQRGRFSDLLGALPNETQ